jgi:hypothetical protein
MHTMIRLAIYYTPPPGSDLVETAAAWLGRNNTTGSYLGQPELFSVSRERLREITKTPFHYGFHGTIKPPFQLAPNVTIEQVVERLEEFAVHHKQFVLPPLELKCMHDFFCLRPTRYCSQLHGLASEAVRYFDGFRLPATDEELQKRRGAGLSPRQETMLTTWGYPYLLDEFRFHLTLTGKLSDGHEKTILQQELIDRFPLQLYQAVPFDALCLFVEIDGAPLSIFRRVILR